VPATLRRVCFIASTAAVGDAVARARARRRMREVFRHHQDAVPPGYDLLLIARKSINGLEYREIERKFIEACPRIAPRIA
jgi:ribonuclease P protein component